MTTFSMDGVVWGELMLIVESESSDLAHMLDGSVELHNGKYHVHIVEDAHVRYLQRVYKDATLHTSTM